MDTIQLTLILRKDKFTRGVFQGVYPSDKLPASVSQYPALYIANVDTSDKPGSHWVAFYFTKEQEGEFFDSYGAPLSKYSGTFTTFLNNNSNQWIFNAVILQSIYSKVCGHHCLYFALYRSGQISMSTIVHSFSNKTRITEDKTKRQVDFENCRLVSKDAVQLFAESSGTDRGQAEIIPIL